MVVEREYMRCVGRYVYFNQPLMLGTASKLSLGLRLEWFQPVGFHLKRKDTEIVWACEKRDICRVENKVGY